MSGWSRGFGPTDHGLTLYSRAVGVFDSPQAGGDPGLAGRDGVAVLPAEGPLRQGLAKSFYFADVGFAFGGVRSDGEHDGAGRGRVENEADRPAFRVAVRQSDGPGTIGLGPGRLGLGTAVSAPVVKAGQQDIRTVDLIAGRAEVLADRAKVGAAGNAVLHEPGGLNLVGIGTGTGVDAQLRLECWADRSGGGEVDHAPGENRRLRPGGQPDGQPPGGEVINAGAVGCDNAVADETLIERQVRERPVLRKSVVMLTREVLRRYLFCACWRSPIRMAKTGDGRAGTGQISPMMGLMLGRMRRSGWTRLLRAGTAGGRAWTSH